MAVPFLNTLPASARLAYPHIVAGVRRGLSGNAIERSIRAAGLRITRATVLTPLIARIKAIELHGNQIRFANKRFTIQTNLLPESITDIRERFSYTYKVDGVNAAGELQTKHVTVTTDNAALTVQELDDSARELATGETTSGSLTDVEVVLDFGIRRAGDF